MKGFKFSKIGVLILAAGAFVVVLASLGFLRYGQISEQDILNKDLSLSITRLDNLDIKPLQTQLTELQEQLQDSESQVAEAKIRLDQTVISVDVADEFYKIASYHQVIVGIIGTTQIQTELYEYVDCSITTINAVVEGDLTHIIDFIAGLNDNFATGFVRSVQISITDAVAERGTAATIMMVVYSYEGS